MPNITIITGSTLGNTEDFSEYLTKKLQLAGISTTLLHGPNLGELNLSGQWLVITSTYGAGDLPDNLRLLSIQLEQKKPNLSQVYFSLIGLGDSRYDQFCGAIKKLEQQFIARGAIQIGNKLEIDVVKYPIPEVAEEKWFVNWIENFLSKNKQDIIFRKACAKVL